MVDGGRDFRQGKKLLEHFASEITDTNASGKAKSIALFHGFPNRLDIKGMYQISLNRHAFHLFPKFERPMDDVHVNVLQSKIPTLVNYIDQFWLDFLF